MVKIIEPRDSAQLRLMISIIFVPLISGSVEMNL